MQPYIKCTFRLNPPDPWRDLLIASLGDTGFEAFEETADGVNAYIQKGDFDEILLSDTVENYRDQCEINYETSEIAPENWNTKWEQSFSPVIVDDQCIVRAPFHESAGQFRYEILLTPRMAFGTGHHQTTFLMIRQMLNLHLTGKNVLDMGCGTGVLAILAAKMGASKVVAIDIDDWAYENSLENIAINKTEHIIVEKGGASRLEGRSFNVILANINKNVLLEDIRRYAACLENNGYLLLSGFFQEDVEDIDKECEKAGLKRDHMEVLRNWTMIQYLK